MDSAFSFDGGTLIAIRAEMNNKKLFFLVAMALAVLAFSESSTVTSQQIPTCPSENTTGKTEKQLRLEECACEQAGATDAPAYRVGSSPFGWKADRRRSPRVGVAARPGTRRSRTTPEPEDLFGGLEMPDLKDLRSPQVVGLKEQVLRQRQSRWRAAENEWLHVYRNATAQELTKPKYAGSLDQYIKPEYLQPGRAQYYRQVPPEEYLKSPEIVSEILSATRQSDQNFVRWEEIYRRFKALQTTDQWPTLAKFDWREQGLDVGGVMNQGACESCWAFATISVYQASWYLELMRSGEYFLASRDPEVPTYQDRIGSIQELLNCISKDKGDCGGGWHGSAFAFMVDSHVPHIPDRLVERLMITRLESGNANAFAKLEVEGYTGRKSRCTDVFRRTRVRRGGGNLGLTHGGSAAARLPANSDLMQTAFDRALAWGYVNETKPDEIPSVEQLKRSLIEHGPLVAPLHGDSCFGVYKSGTFNGHHNEGLNHVVVLIGWDDEKQAWLIKNSWGEEWGEKGFAWVAYGSNNIGLFAAWIQPSPRIEQ